MIIDQYYINARPIQARIDTGLAADELEIIVGRFRKDHQRAGHLKGELLKYADGSVVIRQHFTKKKLWVSE